MSRSSQIAPERSEGHDEHMVRAIGQATAGAAVGVVDVVFRSRIVAAVSEHVLEQVVTVLLQSESVDRAAERVLDSPKAERLVARVMEGPLLEEAIARLLESEELWRLVDEVARSPSVTQAISHQSIGLAEEVTGVIRTQSERADARLERVARRLVRLRPPRPAAPAGPAGPEPLPGG